MKVSEVIRKARKLIETKGFTKMWFARDINGDKCSYTSKNAVCFCAMGALYRTTLNSVTNSDLAYRYLNRSLPAAQVKAFSYVEKYNDESNTRKRHIINLFKRAEKLAIEEGN